MSGVGAAERVEAAIQTAFKKIAPEANIATLDPNQPIRDQIDLDSMDQLNVMINLHEILGVDIPEADYRRTATLAGMRAYLTERLSKPALKP